MHPQRTLIEAAHQIALDEIALVPQGDSPQNYDHKAHSRAYINAIANLPNDGSDETLRAKEAALSQHHPLKYHAFEAAESIASGHNEEGNPDVGEIMNFHFTKGYLPAIQRHHADKYSKLVNVDNPHQPTIDSHADAFEDHVGALLETHYGIRIGEGGKTEDIH